MSKKLCNNFSGKLIILLFVLLLLFSLAVIAAPPSLDNQQFLGNIHWDVNVTPAPTYVEVFINGVSYFSDIKDVKCTHVCSGTYGKNSDNILRFPGVKDNDIEFYLDDNLLTTKKFIPNAVTEFDIKTNKEPLVKEECKPNWDWSEWTDCENETQNRTGIDENQCNPKELNKTEEQSCGEVEDTVDDDITDDDDTLCGEDWQCTEWSECFASQKTRVCSDLNSCDTTDDKPDETLFCLEEIDESDDLDSTPTPTATPSSSLEDDESCFDSIKNQDEEDVDCGGSYCNACESNTLLWVLVISLLVVLLGGGAYYYFVVMKGGSLSDFTGGSEPSETTRPSSRPSLPSIGGSSFGGGLTPSVRSQLKSTYDKGMAKGLSKVQITQKLSDRGWDSKLLRQFLESS